MAHLSGIPRARSAMISPGDFERFRALFYSNTGITFENSKRYFVDKRLLDRIEATGSANFDAYLSLLRTQRVDQEMQCLINTMTVNETYFLREAYQFDCLSGSILPEVVRQKQRGERIRIWCVPSSTGEEAYSIALHLLECWPALAHWDVEIVGSDIDTEVLIRARAGRYGDRAVQGLPPTWIAKYFTVVNGAYQLCDDVRQAVTFTRVNVAAPIDHREIGAFDVIFCRNMLIYFDDASRLAAAETFYDALNPGGFICLGHSESMSRISSLFKVRKFPQAIVYQKPLDAQ